MFIVLFSPLSLNAEHVGPLVTDTAEPVEEGQFSFQVTSSLFIKQGRYDQEGALKYSPSGDRGYQWGTILKPYYGLFEDFEVSAGFPLRYNWVTQNDRSAGDGGIGDILIGANIGLLKTTKTDPVPPFPGLPRSNFLRANMRGWRKTSWVRIRPETDPMNIS